MRIASPKIRNNPLTVVAVEVAVTADVAAPVTTEVTPPVSAEETTTEPVIVFFDTVVEVAISDSADVAAEVTAFEISGSELATEAGLEPATTICSLLLEGWGSGPVDAIVFLSGLTVSAMLSPTGSSTVASAGGGASEFFTCGDAIEVAPNFK